MKSIYVLSACFFLSIFSPSRLLSQQLDHILGDVLVHLDADTEVERLIVGLRSYKGKTTQLQIKRAVAPRQSIYLLSFDHNTIHEYHFVDHIHQFPGVIAAQFNHLVSNRIVPDDPIFDQQWHWLNDGSIGTLDADLDLPEAWDVTTGGLTANGDTIVVAVIDDGTDFDHEDTADNIWFNHAEIPNNGIDDDNNGYVDDYRGWDPGAGDDDVDGGNHGLRVSGMIGAVGNNGVGVTGVNWDVKVMNILLGPLTEDAVIAGYAYPLWFRKKYNETNGQEGAFVVATNSSWGIDGGNPADAPIWCAFYDTLAQAGIISCGATANVNWNIDIEGDLPTGCPSPFMVSVTATDRDDQRNFSAFGFENVDIAAPGEDVMTTIPNNGYGTTSGTSFASPTVAGVIALLYSAPCSNIASLALADPMFVAEQMLTYIYAGVDIQPNLLGDIATGGRVNANNSLLLLLENCGPCPPPAAVSFADIIDTSATITWVTPDSALSVNLQYRLLGDTVWTEVADVSSPFSLSGLAACSSYELELEAICADTTSGFTNTLLLDTDGCCVSPMDLVISDLTDTSALASWESILAAQSYNLRYRPVGTGIWTEVNTTELTLELLDLTACTEYEAQIQTVCDTGATNYALPVTFQTFGCGACLDSVYCASASLDSDFEFIEAVQLGNIDNVSGSNGGYTFFPDQTTTLLAGVNYNMTLTPGFAGFPFFENFRVWIDLDANGTFDNDELMLGPIATDQAITLPLVIPNSAVNGYTRMRVALNFSEDWGPCEDFTFGEVEDYCITIEGSTGCYAPPLSVLDVTETDAMIQVETVPIATDYLLQVRPFGSTIWTSVSFTDPIDIILSDLEPCTDYELRIRTFCDTLTSIYGPLVSFRTMGCGACTDLTYCANQALFNVFELIDTFYFDNYVNASGDDDGYGDYTGDPILVEAGQSYPLRIVPDPNPNFFEMIYIVYLDSNQDGVFQPTELLYQSDFVTTDIVADVTIPMDALEGITRMRVQLSEEDLGNPCGEFFYGEVEDYCLEIMPPVIPCTPPTIEEDDLTMTSIQIKWDPIEPSIGYNIRFRELGTDDWSENATIDTFFFVNELEVCTDYEFEIRAICPNELSGYSTTMVIKTECPTSISDPDLASWEAFPNPFTDQLTLQLHLHAPKEVNIEVMTISGQRIWSETHNLMAGSNALVLDSGENWPEGMYLLRLTTDSGVSTRRLVKASW